MIVNLNLSHEEMVEVRNRISARSAVIEQGITFIFKQLRIQKSSYLRYLL